MGPILGIACPQIVYPYLRGNVADVIQRGGFPPVHLAEINFQAMYEQQQASQADGAARPRRIDAVIKPFGLQRCPRCAGAMKIVVLGAGAWGTALAISAPPRGAAPRSRCGRAMRRRPQAMQAQRVNARYLPGIALPRRRWRARGGRCAAAVAAARTWSSSPRRWRACASMLAQLRDLRVPGGLAVQGLRGAARLRSLWPAGP